MRLKRRSATLMNCWSRGNAGNARPPSRSSAPDSDEGGHDGVLVERGVTLVGMEATGV